MVTNAIQSSQKKSQKVDIDMKKACIWINKKVSIFLYLDNVDGHGK